jgi:AcrR family transcriptional regulator
MSPVVKARFLDVAESLYARSGTDALTIKNVATDANSFVSELTYNFDSKERLIEAVLLRALAPAYDERMYLLSSLRSSSECRNLTPAEIVVSILLPTVRAIITPRLHPDRTATLRRAASDDTTLVRRILIAHGNTLGKMQHQAFIASALPLSAAEASFRKLSYFGARAGVNTYEMLTQALASGFAPIDALTKIACLVEILFETRRSFSDVSALVRKTCEMTMPLPRI